MRSLLTYRLPTLPQVKVGGRLGWQSTVRSDTYREARQEAYALLDLMTTYDIDDHWSTSLNLNNVTDRKYLQSLQTGSSSNYGAPRNLTASVTWTSEGARPGTPTLSMALVSVGLARDTGDGPDAIAGKPAPTGP